MKARALGFQLLAGQGVTLDQLSGRLIEVSATDPVSFDGLGRLLYSSIKERDLVGMFVTVRDNRRLLTLSRGTRTVTARELAQDEDLIDFNFFVVSLQTGRGLYLYYRGSCPLTTFHAFCDGHYRHVREKLLEAAYAKTQDALGVAKLSALQESRVRDGFKGPHLRLEYVIEEKGWEELLNGLQSVNGLTYDVVTLRPDIRPFQPLSNYLEKSREQLTFSIDQRKRHGLKAKLASVLRSPPGRATNIRITGLDPKGVERHINLVENFSGGFKEYDYDELVGRMTFQLPNFARSGIMAELLALSHENPALIRMPTRP